MQIQRLQTLWLIMAIILGVASSAFPWLNAGGEVVKVCDVPALCALVALSLALPCLGIFMYRNLRRQKIVAKLAALFSLFAVAYGVAMSFIGPNAEAEVEIPGPVLMCVSCLFDCLAVRGISKDEQLLRAADRLR